MLNIQGSPVLRKIVVLNPKGGAGKTTLAFNIAGYLASTGRKVTLIDMDQQGSSNHWLVRRPTEFPVIHGVNDFPYIPGKRLNATITLPEDIDFAVLDTPAGVTREDLADFTVGSHAIIVPVMPSEIDIHASIQLIADLLLVAKGSRENKRLGVIANRVKERTVAANHLMTFLNRLSIPVVGVIRDSQNYVNAAREGLCIHELLPSRAGKDLWQWKSITKWLEQRLETPLNERDLQRAKARPQPSVPGSRVNYRLAAAAVLAVVVISALLWLFTGESGKDLTNAPVVAVNPPVQSPAKQPQASMRPDRTAEPAIQKTSPPASASIDPAVGDSATNSARGPTDSARPEIAAGSGSAWQITTSDGTSISSGQLSAPGTVAYSVGPAVTGEDSDEPYFRILGEVDDSARPNPDEDTYDTTEAVNGQTVSPPTNTSPVPKQSSNPIVVVTDEPSPPQRKKSQSPTHSLERRWQLAGVIDVNDGYVVLLTNLTDGTTRSVAEGGNVDGWTLKEAGKEFAVLTRNGEQTRLSVSPLDGELNDSPAR